MKEKVVTKVYFQTDRNRSRYELIWTGYLSITPKIGETVHFSQEGIYMKDVYSVIHSIPESLIEVYVR